MKTNAGVVIVRNALCWRCHSIDRITGQRVALVPYEKEHVPKYHNWMKDPWLQEMTASEPLSLEEEFEMQKSWKEDAKKCTFIVLAKAEGDGQQETSYVDESAIRRMVGDVNLFFNDHDDHQASTATLSVSRFFCKIIESNTASLHLFDKLGYVKYNYVAAFKQVEMELVTRDKHAELVDAVLKSAVIYLPHFIEQ
uniref:Uncharacterized protein n=1 Tax=Hyaloperonospora arabidopsidis (strain Emoy2) TaxID=559515 RepID=M4B270_HYAAE